MKLKLMKALQEIRKKQGISQSQFAKTMEIDQQTLSVMENSASCRLSNIQKYIDRLGAKATLVVDVNGEKYEIEF